MEVSAAVAMLRIQSPSVRQTLSRSAPHPSLLSTYLHSHRRRVGREQIQLLEHHGLECSARWSSVAAPLHTQGYLSLWEGTNVSTGRENNEISQQLAPAKLQACGEQAPALFTTLWSPLCWQNIKRRKSKTSQSTFLEVTLSYALCAMRGRGGGWQDLLSDRSKRRRGLV